MIRREIKAFRERFKILWNVGCQFFVFHAHLRRRVSYRQRSEAGDPNNTLAPFAASRRRVRSPTPLALTPFLLDSKALSFLYGRRMKAKSQTQILWQSHAREALLHGGTVDSFVRLYHPNLRFSAFRAYIGAVRDALFRPRITRRQSTRVLADCASFTPAAATAADDQCASADAANRAAVVDQSVRKLKKGLARYRTGGAISP